VKRALRIGIAAAAVVVVGGIGVFAFRGKIFPAAAADPKDPVGYTTTKVTRGDIVMNVAASGQFEPNTITTIRPDSNMPTRKIVSILVKEGQKVRAGEALAMVDATGLDLNVKQAGANYEAQRVKLDNLKAKPVGLDLAAAQASLTQAEINLASQQENYDNVKALADKGLASKNQLSDAERQLALSKLNLEAASLSYQNVKAQSQADVIQAQEASVAQADNDLQMARLVLDSAMIRSPAAGVVAEILVKEGDLASPSTAVMTVVDPDPMILLAQVNETDMQSVKIGSPATVTPSGTPDVTIEGKVTGIDLHAQVQSNVSVFTTSISVANRDGKILWGMNADAEITVLDVKNTLMVPTSAVRTVNGASQVTILDEGKLISWEVQTGANDGTHTEILGGLDEGQEVAILPRRAPTTTNTQAGGPPGGGMNQIFRVMH